MPPRPGRFPRFETSSRRPRRRTFFSGSDVYDQRNVGFVSNVGTEGTKKYNAFDTTRRGNGNGGHFGRAYGTDLDAADTEALLEYLKTL